METQSHENLQQNDSSNEILQNDPDSVHNDASNHRDTAEQNPNSNSNPNPSVSREQVIQILQVIASTGRFWHDWDNLKSMLSFQLKQLLSEYPEAKMTSEEQYASLGESHSELVNKLDEALTCFIDGPPFTLQRLCEILLDAKSIYPNLSKLALALEKNLLVTSTLTISTDPYPQTTVQEPDDQEKASEKQQQSNSAQNGIEPRSEYKDEVMAEADVGDDMTIDMEPFADAKSSEANSEPNANNNA